MHTGYCVDQLLIVGNDLYKMQSYGRCFNSQGKKIQILYVTLIYSVPKGDLHTLVSLKISSSSTSFNTY